MTSKILYSSKYFTIHKLNEIHFSLYKKIKVKYLFYLVYSFALMYVVYISKFLPNKEKDICVIIKMDNKSI